MTAFNAHAHVIVPELLRNGAPGETRRPRVDWREGRQVVEFDEETRAAVLHGNAERELRRMPVTEGHRG